MRACLVTDLSVWRGRTMARTKQGAARARTAAVVLGVLDQIQRCRGRACGTEVSRLSSVHMYVLAHTWRAVDEQRCTTVLAKTGAAVQLCPYAGAVGGADKRNGVKGQSKDKQGSGLISTVGRGRYRRLTLSAGVRPRYSPTQPHTTTHPTASIPPIPNLRDCLTSISSRNLNLDLVHRETSLPHPTIFNTFRNIHTNVHTNSMPSCLSLYGS